MSSWSNPTNLGNILIRMGALTSPQLADALTHQQELQKTEQIALLGEICVEMKFISQEQLDAALAEQKSLQAPPCNASAVDQAFDDLDLAVRRAKSSSKKLTATMNAYVDSRRLG